MRRPVSLGGAVLCALVLLAPPLVGPSAHADSTVTQTFQLRPGWNAIFLDVEPEGDTPAEVFGALPVESVWTHFTATSSVQFIQNPDETAWDKTAWGAYFPAGEKAFLTNLYGVPAGRAYLVKLAGDEAVEWSVSGVPAVNPVEWATDAFHLTGFRVATAAAPSFAEWLSPSAAHAEQALYRLSDDGVWEYVDDPAAATIRAGEAYWVYCEGASEYQGPLQVQLPSPDGIDFGAYADTLSVILKNVSNQTLSVSFSALSADVELLYRTFDNDSGSFEWPPLAGMPAVSLNPGTWSNVRLGVRRDGMTSERAASVLQISDDLGSRILVPVTVEMEAVQ